MTATVGSLAHPIPAMVGAPGTGITNGTVERPFADANAFPFNPPHHVTADPAAVGAGVVGTELNPFLVQESVVPVEDSGFSDGFSDGFGG
jgi:hypothetical protein